MPDGNALEADGNALEVPLPVLFLRCIITRVGGWGAHMLARGTQRVACSALYAEGLPRSKAPKGTRCRKCACAFGFSRLPLICKGRSCAGSTDSGTDRGSPLQPLELGAGPAAEPPEPPRYARGPGSIGAQRAAERKKDVCPLIGCRIIVLEPNSICDTA